VYLEITGTTTINSFGTVAAGAIRQLTFTGILTLTYNATSLILPGAANIITAAGDTATFRSLGGGNWRCVDYLRANGSNPANTITNATIVTPTLTLKQSATPTPTAEGDIQWDTDDNVLAIGDGAATKLFLPIPASTTAGDLEYYTAAKVLARLPKGTAGQTLRMNAAATAPEWGGGNGVPDAVMEDQKSTGTGAQSLPASTWTKRNLNTEVRDPSGLVSIASDEFTVTVNGWVEWDSPCLTGTRHQSRLYSVTDAAAVAYGTSEWSDDAGTYATSSSKGNAAVTGGKTYRIEHNTSNSGTGGPGSGVNFAGNVEIYTRVKFWRTA
jgi:hypothetical protein